MTWKNDQVSEIETEKILELASECLKVEGDFVEMGCYKGDTSLLLAELLVENSVNKAVNKLGKNGEKGVGNDVGVVSVKKLWIYDSFEGLPEKNAVDESALGVNFKKGELFVTKKEVKGRFLRAGLPVPVIKKAWFSELTEENLPSKIAFAFLDGDLYESIRDSLKLVGLKMSKDGIIVVHDYNNPALPGVKEAVDKWLEGKNWQKEVFRSIVILKML